MDMNPQSVFNLTDLLACPPGILRSSLWNLQLLAQFKKKMFLLFFLKKSDGWMTLFSCTSVCGHFRKNQAEFGENSSEISKWFSPLSFIQIFFSLHSKVI